MVHFSIGKYCAHALVEIRHWPSLFNEWDQGWRSICYTAAPPSILFVILSQVKSADLKKLRANTKETPLHVVLGSIGERMRNFVAKSGIQP